MWQGWTKKRPKSGQQFLHCMVWMYAYFHWHTSTYGRRLPTRADQGALEHRNRNKTGFMSCASDQILPDECGQDSNSSVQTPTKLDNP